MARRFTCSVTFSVVNEHLFLTKLSERYVEAFGASIPPEKPFSLDSPDEVRRAITEFVAIFDQSEWFSSNGVDGDVQMDAAEIF